MPILNTANFTGHMALCESPSPAATLFAEPHRVGASIVPLPGRATLPTRPTHEHCHTLSREVTASA